MNRTRFCALLLALLLAVPARAAGSPSLTVSQDGEAGWSVSLEGLEERYCGVEAALTLDGTADAQFLLDSGLEDSHPSVYAACQQEGKQVVLYVVAKSPLNDGETVRLGSLTADGAVSGIAVSSLRLLTLEDLTGSFPGGGAGTEVPVQPPVQPTIPPSGNPDPVVPPSGNPDPVVPPSSGGQEPALPPESMEYRINVLDALGSGSVSVSLLRARPGDAVTVTVSPDAGCELEELTVTAPDGAEAALTSLGGGRYRFTMPRSSVTIRASFSAAAVQEPALPAPSLPFLDVPADSWYREAVAYVYESGLMRGTDDHAFTPGGLTTRAQIVTILHRMEGEPAVVETGRFRDVERAQWYTAAVEWAAGQEIVDGYGDDRFGPGDNITREQLAAILYRYARCKGLDLTASEDVSSFRDASEVSGWALQAMRWANGSGLITGKEDNLLDPGGNATRAEAATILMRFCLELAGG